MSSEFIPRRWGAKAQRATATLSMLAAVALTSAAAQAAARTLIAEPREGVKIRVDGDLREWPTRMTSLGETLRGPGIEARAVVGYDEKYIYLALRVADMRIARSAAAGPNEDHATLALAFPKGRGYVTYPIAIYPGKPGKLPAVVKMNGKAVLGAKAVENPTDSELLLEAQIPWSAFPEAKSTRVGLRASVSYASADAPGALKTVVSTAKGKTGKALGALLLEAEQGLGELLRDKGLSDVPAREAYGNLSGDSMLERVALFGRYLTISGPRFRGGKEFYFAEIGIQSPGMLKQLSLADLDGDGLQEIVLKKRIGSSDEYREILEILKVGKDDLPAPAFSHEIGIKTPEGWIENKVTLKGRSLEIAQGESEGFEPDTYAEVLPSSMPSALLPWDSVGSRRYEWRGNTFVQTDEQTVSPKQAASSGRASQNEPAARSTAKSPMLVPRTPTADEMLDRVYALYKRERGVSKAKPRFDFVIDVAGDEAPERVLVHDKDIVVFGKGFRGGSSYSFISVGVEDPKHILDATARDITGDGKAEILVRAVMRAKASKALGGDTVDRHAFLVYAIRGDALVRIFAAETGRALGKNQVLGTLALQSAPRGLSIELKPGRAIGWTENTYPFPPDSTTAGGLEPLLLPWSDDKRTYRFDGRGFVLQSP